MEYDLVVLYTVLAVGILTFCSILKKANGWFYTIKFGSKKYRLPPGDMGWPFIGNMLYFVKCLKGHDLEPFVKNLVIRFGRGGMYKAFMFGRPSIIVTSPEICRKILLDDDNFPLSFPNFLLNLLGQEPGDGYSEHDKLLRKVVAIPVKTHPSLSHFFDAINQIVKDSFEKWVAMEEHIEILAAIRKPAFGVFMQVFMGGEQPAQEILDYLFEENLYRFRGLKALAINLPGFAYNRGIKARKAVAKVLQQLINERKVLNANNKARSKHNMMDMMLDAQAADEEISDEEIIKWLLSFLFGGYETVSLVASKTIMHLQKHPEFLLKAKEEQEEIVKRRSSPNAGLSFNEIGQMKYLTKVIYETMRFGSTEIIFFRDARTTVNINGYTIPKGWKVLTIAGNWYMDPNTYVNPKDFNPSRWDDLKTKPTSYLPFGLGPRTCTGSNLAMLEVSVILHYLLLNYRLELLPQQSKTIPPEKCLVRIKKLSASYD